MPLVQGDSKLCNKRGRYRCSVNTLMTETWLRTERTSIYSLPRSPQDRRNFVQEAVQVCGMGWNGRPAAAGSEVLSVTSTDKLTCPDAWGWVQATDDLSQTGALSPWYREAHGAGVEWTVQSAVRAGMAQEVKACLVGVLRWRVCSSLSAAGTCEQPLFISFFLLIPALSSLSSSFLTLCHCLCLSAAPLLVSQVHPHPFPPARPQQAGRTVLSLALEVHWPARSLASLNLLPGTNQGLTC